MSMFSLYPTHFNIYLSVPFSLKEEAKKLKMRWNPSKKLWYLAININNIDPEDYEMEIISLLRNEIFQFNLHSTKFSSVYHDEENFYNKFREQYTKKQTEL